MKALDGCLKHLRNYDGAKTKKRKTTEEHMASVKTIKVVRPTPPPLVENHEADDMVAYQRNVVLLQQQAKKVAPSQHIVTELMDKTFLIRRKTIVSNPSRVAG